DGGGGFTSDPDFVYDPSTDTLYAKNVYTTPEIYGPGWDGDNTCPTKNDVYDKMETIAAAASPVPVFFTASPFSVVPTSGRQEYLVLSGAVNVTTATKLVWAMLRLTGTGTVKKKLKKSYPWSFEVQLR